MSFIHVLCLAYDGTEYYGWQRTHDGPTIEELLSNALKHIFQEPTHLIAASRTDRGVHAFGQVVAFRTQRAISDYSRLIISINALLPSDIRVTAAHATTNNFHPTLDAIKKQYRYLISVGPVQPPFNRTTHWHVHYPLDKNLLYKSAEHCIGTHDFRGLCNFRKDLNDEDTIRTVYDIKIVENKNQVAIDIEANKFLYKMARNIVGTLIWIARKKIPETALQQAIRSRKRALAGVTAPAHGLTLMKVFYPNIDFERSNLI